MYKTILRLLFASIILLGGFTSCRKNYDCVCTTSSGSVANSNIKTTKKKATNFCSDQETSTKKCTLQ